MKIKEGLWNGGISSPKKYYWCNISGVFSLMMKVIAPSSDNLFFYQGLLLLLGGLLCLFYSSPSSSSWKQAHASSLYPTHSLYEQVDEADSPAAMLVLEINATGHVFPYTATAITLSCLMAVIMVIICLGNNLGQS
eukprot:scaffold912_cov187-Ochromonas_danica.AAC.6